MTTTSRHQLPSTGNSLKRCDRKNWLAKIAIITISATSVWGCASNQTIPLTKGNTPTKLTQEQTALLQSNGFTNGSWSANCADPKFTREIVTTSQESIFISVVTDSKRTSYDYVYETKPVSNGVISIKTKTADSLDPQTLTSKISGFTNGKRMTFESRAFYLTGAEANKEVTLIKEGYEVKESSNGTLIKIKVSQPLAKCEK